MAVWVRRRDTQNELELIPSQEAGQSIATVQVTPQLREDFKRALYVFTAEGRVLRAGRAAIFLLESTGWGGGWLPRLLARPPFIFFVELGYRIVARNRSFFSRFLFRP
jgi:predicted DCC family thiol-disulfide oxidoreductase YuxK